MSLPDFSTQGELFSTAGLPSSLFRETDRYRLFTQKVYPHLVQSRATSERCYCDGCQPGRRQGLRGHRALRETDDDHSQGEGTQPTGVHEHQGSSAEGGVDR